MQLPRPLPLSKTLLLAAALALVGSAAIAQTVYRIVGPDGKVSFSDQPPPPSAPARSSVATPGRATGGSSGTGLPYELQQVARQFPVTLYTAADCNPCAAARNLLVSRGVPFTERTITSNEDIDALRRISGEGNLPFGTIGGQQLKGFSDVEWTQYLDAAAYPKTSQLPPTYRAAPPTPLVAVRPAETPSAQQPSVNAPAAQNSPQPQGPSNSNPTGIQF